MSGLVDFYRGRAADSVGRQLADLWAWDDNELEVVHDFIQWLFPLPEASRFNPDAPLLSEDDITAFRAEPLLREHLLRSLQRFLAFLGLAAEADGRVTEGPNFSVRVPDVWAYPNHNWLRITRVLRCLRLLELEEQARALYRWLEATYRERRFPISADTVEFWHEAVEGLPFHR
jgi:hypothetical protein